MSKFKTKNTTTIDSLIRLTREGKLVWKFVNENNTEKLRCSYLITKDKFIGCEIIKYLGGTNYFINFYYKGKKLTTYYYQHISKIFDLFIYAKYVSYIMDIGNDSFVDTLCNHFDNYEWESSFKKFMYSTELESIDKKYAGIDVAKGNIEIVINDDLLYNINDSRLYKLLDSYENEDIVTHNENVEFEWDDEEEPPFNFDSFVMIDLYNRFCDINLMIKWMNENLIYKCIKVFDRNNKVIHEKILVKEIKLDGSRSIVLDKIKYYEDGYILEINGSTIYIMDKIEIL